MSSLHSWLRNAGRGRLAAAAAALPAEEPKFCHLGVVLALGIESGCLEDLLQGVVTIRGNGFVLCEGGLGGRRVVTILSGPGRRNAARATDLLIDGHRPRRVISAGLAGGLCPELKRNDILVADRLLNSEGGEMSIELPPGAAGALAQPGVHRGALLTGDRVVRLPSARQALHERYGAMAIDMETFAVAEVCRRRNVPFSAIRAINDTAGDALPRDVEYLLGRKPGAAQWGAALGSICRRPASIKDLYRLRENALVASLRLAEFVAAVDFD